MRNKLVFLLSIGLILSACNNAPSSSETKKEHSPYLFITEINTGTSVVNRAIEFANTSNEDIVLDGYSLNVYRSPSSTPSERISLDGHIIKANSTFVVAYNQAKEEILEKANLVTENYLNDGTFPVALAFQGEAFDSVGVIGFNYNFAQSAVLVRLKEHYVQTLDFKTVNWVRYPINTTKTLGNIDVISEEDLENGPKLTQQDLSTPFCTDASKGDGGAHKVSYVRNIDGDTTIFNYGNKYASYGVSGTLSTRYFGINTPEIAHSAGEVADPYGNEARDFTSSQLSKAKNYIVQSVNGYSINETYGRMLGYIWVAFNSNPAPEDYILLNHLILKNGLAHSAFLNRSEAYHSLMTYKGVSFIEYICHAEEYAQEHQLNIFSKYEGALL